MSFETYLRVGIDASGSTAGANVHKQATDKIISASEKAIAAQQKFDAQMRAAKVAVIAFATTALYSAVRTISEYQTSLAAAGAVTRATAADMVRLEGITRKLGATTEFSAAQAAEGAKFLGMAGFRTNEIMAALPVTLDLATVAQMDLGRSADITSNIMSGFSLRASEASRAADVLAAIATSANTDVSGMGQAMKYVGPIAKSLGISMEDTAAAVGVLANQGIQGSMAGTSLKTSLSALLSTAKPVVAGVKSLGLTMEQVNPQTHSLAEIIKTLSEAGLDAERAFAIFGQRGATAMLALTGNVPELEKLTNITNTATGTLEQMTKVMRDTLLQDFKTMTSALSELALAVGDSGLTRAVRSYLQEATKWITSLSDTLNGINKNREQAQFMADAINLLKNAVISLMALKLIDWLFAAGNAMRLLNLAMSLNPWVVAGTVIGAGVLHLKDVHDETVRLTEVTKKQTETLKEMAEQYSLSANKAVVETLRMQRQAIGSLKVLDMEIAQRQSELAQQEPIGFGAGGEAIYSEYATKLQNEIARRQLMKNQIDDIDNEIQSALKRIAVIEDPILSKALAGGRQLGKAVIDGFKNADWSDVRNFLGAYIPVIGRGEVAKPTGGAGGGTSEKKESFMVKELANAKLALELSKNLGAAESELYRIKLQSEALQEAREAGLKNITAETQKMINQAVALNAEEIKIKTSYEAQKQFTDQINEKYKAQQASLTLAQNLGATESEILRIQLEAQASDAARKAGLDGISQAWQSIIDKIVVVSAIEAEAKKNYEMQQKAKKAVEDKTKELEIETRRNELTKQYSGNLRELDIQMQIFNATREAGIQVGSTEYTEMEKKIRQTNELKKNTKEVTDATEKAAAANKEWAQSMTYAFKDAIMNSKNLGDALSNLANKVQNMLVNKALDSLLGGLFSGFAKGDVFSGGRNMAFAAGGVVNGPTIFPMATGMGLMGEAGPEAIMPLTRTSSGELGVQAVGGGSGGVSIVNQFEINIEGGNKEENEDAANQVSSAIMRIIDDKIVNVILREKRPGGALR